MATEPFGCADPAGAIAAVARVSATGSARPAEAAKQDARRSRWPGSVKALVQVAEKERTGRNGCLTLTNCLAQGGYFADVNHVGLIYYLRRTGVMRHLYVYHAAAFTSDHEILAILSAMRSNPSLDAMARDVDYRWIGACGVLFRSKKDAALFRLFHCGSGSDIPPLVSNPA